MPKKIVGVEVRYKEINKQARILYLVISLISMLCLTILFIFFPEVFGLQGMDTVVLRDDVSYLSGSCKVTKNNQGGIFIRLKTYPHTFFHPNSEKLKCNELLSNHPSSIAIEVEKDHLDGNKPIKVVSIMGKSTIYLEPSIFTNSSGPYQLLFTLLIAAFLIIATILTVKKSRSK
jgi:hypothetical protein